MSPQSDAPRIVPSAVALCALARLLRGAPADAVPVVLAPGKGLTRLIALTREKNEEAKN